MLLSLGCSKEKGEYEDNILRDLDSLGVKYCAITHTSDYFDLIESYARKLITEGKAFMDDTPREKMQAERAAFADSVHRYVTTTCAVGTHAHACIHALPAYTLCVHACAPCAAVTRRPR